VSIAGAGLALAAALSAGTPSAAHSPHVVLTGVIRSLGVLQTEPSETPQTSFMLVTTELGMRRELLVMIPGRTFCFEGERATVEGDLTPAEAPFPDMLLDARLASCF